ncbi:recombinase family protein [Spirosoma endbachense]|jgi:DNA invertase Pin-like site-specific DNA recombinase|uniref:Helix-turn-helix domain-containing protein n=1 Tax=Spirosoma endbachense TaxID=2666025 RepID=A0A6P1VY67_9BACT|nr:recombinase family protein [Spirosoma endbachense]QHV96697.1 helix-turn-helix domain-containing protein [Spirosoma endbachense]
MLFGYARVSTQDQNLNLQLDDLKKAGCQKIFQEKVSSIKERPQLQKLLEILREGDTIMVWKLDRLGRSLKELFTLVNDFQAKGIGFCSLNDAIDTTTAQGRLVFNLFASLAEFERDLIRERTKAGLAAARARGRVGGRPKGLSTEAQVKARAVKSMHALKTHTIPEIGQLFHLSRATVYRYLAWQEKKEVLISK